MGVSVTFLMKSCSGVFVFVCIGVRVICLHAYTNKVKYNVDFNSFFKKSIAVEFLEDPNLSSMTTLGAYVVWCARQQHLCAHAPRIASYVYTL